MQWIQFLDLFGTFVFAISGVISAIRKKFDLVGSLIIGFVTAIGGGTLRDILIGRTPVGWLNNRDYFVVIFCAFVVAYLARPWLEKLNRSFFLFDSIGIGLFTILGVQIALQYQLNIETCLVLGVISACFGGVIRDVLINEIPLIFRREIYATACFLGGSLYLLLDYLSPYYSANVLASITLVVLIRIIAVKRNWSLVILRK